MTTTALEALVEAADEYLTAQGALDNRELMGPNAAPYEELRAACNSSHEILEDAISVARAALESSAPSAAEPVAWKWEHHNTTTGEFIKNGLSWTCVQPTSHAYLLESGEWVETRVTPLYATQPAASEREAACWRAMTEVMIDEFLVDYEMRGEDEQGRDACYAPSEGERALIKDAIMGLFAEAEDRARAALHSTGKPPAHPKQIAGVGCALCGRNEAGYYCTGDCGEYQYAGSQPPVQSTQCAAPADDSAALTEHEREMNQALAERDEREEVINTILDEVLGTDRHEWSSAYGFADAIEDVKTRMWSLARPSAPEDAKDAARKPLTEEQVDKLTIEQWGLTPMMSEASRLKWSRLLARAVESAHGITDIVHPAPKHTKDATSCILAAIKFAISDDSPKEFLNVWLHGDWDIIRSDWPEAPSDVFPTSAALSQEGGA